jgi:hypothetical protein
VVRRRLCGVVDDGARGCRRRRDLGRRRAGPSESPRRRAGRLAAVRGARRLLVRFPAGGRARRRRLLLPARRAAAAGDGDRHRERAHPR